MGGDSHRQYVEQQRLKNKETRACNGCGEVGHLIANCKATEEQNKIDTAAALKTRDDLRRYIGNFLHESVPKFEKEVFMFRGRT